MYAALKKPTVNMRKPYQSEEMHGPASETAQNDDGYHVEHAVDKAFESEFGVSVFTGAVLDYFFSYFGKTGSLGQHRYVTGAFSPVDCLWI